MEFREELKHEKIGTVKGILWTVGIVAIIFLGLFKMCIRDRIRSFTQARTRSFIR